MKYFIMLVFIFLLNACGSRYFSYAPSASYGENEIRNINDEDILKAFESGPQIVFPVRIAWYNMGNDSLYKSLFPRSGKVALNYQIPKTLVEGFSPFMDTERGYIYYARPIPLNLKALRLLAARAKCDLLVLVSARFNEKRSVNNLAWLNLFIVPLFFTDYMDVLYRYEAELYVFDVRNGYMYRHAAFRPPARTKSIGLNDLEKTAREMNQHFMSEAGVYLREQLQAVLH